MRRVGIPKRRVVRWLAVPVVCLGLLSTTTQPVSANDGDGVSCVVLDFCAWTLQSYGGTMWSWYGQDSDWPSVIDEDESSLRNRSTTYYVRVYDFTGYGTMLYCTPPNSSYTSLGHPNDGNSHTWNNTCL